MPPMSRSTCLAELDTEQLAKWLALVPVLERMAFDPPKVEAYRIRVLGEKQPRSVGSVRELASIAGSPAGLTAIVNGLDGLAHKLLLLAVWRGGTIHRVDVTGATGWPRNPATAARMETEIDAAADRLRFLLLAEPAATTTKSRRDPIPDGPRGDWLRIVDDVKAIIILPGRGANAGLASVVSDELAATLREHKMRDIPPRREDRERVLYGLLTNPDHVRTVADSLPPDARLALDVLLRKLDPVHVTALGVRSIASLDRRYRAATRTVASTQAPTSPIHALYDIGFIGVDSYDQGVWIWREVAQILRPDLIATWETPPVPDPVIFDADRSHIAGPLANLERLLDLWRAAPPPALADGGLGVAPVRAIAKRIGIPAGHAGLLAHLAISIGLLRSSMIGTEGRGRNARAVYGWALTDAVPDWLRLPATQRWALLVQHWLTDDTLVDSDALPERWQPGLPGAEPLRRHLVLRSLEALLPGHGAASGAMASWTVHQCPQVLWPAQTSAVIEAARVLGLVPPDGPVGLTRSARALLDGTLNHGNPSNAADAERPAQAGMLIVQSDRTVIAPPDVDLDARLFLDRIATLENDAGARIYRLTETSLSAAITAGLSAVDIENGLNERSRTPVPQSVSYLITDVDRKRKLITLATAVTVIASSDPALIAAAVRVKAAGLRGLGPYTAVSALPADKVRTALAAKGVNVTVEQHNPPPSTSPRYASTHTAKIPAIGPSPYIGQTKIHAEAARLIDAKARKH